MSVARVTEISSSSSRDFRTAIDSAMKRASETIDEIEGAWVKDMKVTVRDGRVDRYRVTLKVTFVLH